MMRTRTLATVVLSLVALAGCGTATASPGDPATSPGHPTASPAVQSLDEADNGRTVHVAVGSAITVTLHSTYWTFAPVAPAGVLTANGAPELDGGACPPGQGCGRVTAHFTAVASGTAQVSAARTTCGEAMRCGPGQGDYQVTVVVGGA
jgi:hypothetical protein